MIVHAWSLAVPLQFASMTTESLTWTMHVQSHRRSHVDCIAARHILEVLLTLYMMTLAVV